MRTQKHDLKDEIKRLDIMTLTKQLLQEQDLEFTNSQEDFIEVTTLNDKFSLWLNGKTLLGLLLYKIKMVFTQLKTTK